MALTYTNPVWPGYCADPFVLKWQGEYYAYGTGEASADGKEFPLLHSTDFVHWEHLGGGLEPLPGGRHAYWAPEVAAHDGRFYLYYSAADGAGDDTHRLRVAVAEHPTGPFVDSGNLLLPEEGFTIDAHPFRDSQDGRWYLFFAKDFFDARVGTALAAVPLADDMVSVAGPVTTILRPSANWQIYERNRTIYGQVWEVWHTVEGAFVVFHAGRYYLLYSGGAWTTSDYGVGYAVADSVLGPYREPEVGPVVLRGVPGHVRGPGHNSVVLGPDDQTEFIAYHAWDAAHTARCLCLDPLVWKPEGPRCTPSWTPQTLR
jgi:beta-xylosidase